MTEANRTTKLDICQAIKQGRKGETNMYTIGTQYLNHGKHLKLCTIVDIYTTRNNAGAIVETRYVSIHEFCGQQVKDSTANDVTVARGIWKLNEAGNK